MAEKELEKCPRCNKLFSVNTMPVGQTCIPAGEKDWDTALPVLTENPGMNGAALSKESGVPLDVVMRMIDSGYVEEDSDELNEKIKCGRCGAPAISRSKRLCPPCLSRLEMEVAERTREMRDTLFGANSAIPKAEVRLTTLDERQSAKRSRKSEDTPKEAPTGGRGGMASREFIKRKR